MALRTALERESVAQTLACELVWILVVFSRIFLSIVGSQGRGDVECAVHVAAHRQSSGKAGSVQQVVSFKLDQPAGFGHTLLI